MAPAASVICFCCGLSCDEHKSVTCSICKKNFSHACVELNVSEVRTIKTKRGLTWACKELVRPNALGSDISELKVAIVALANEVQAV